MALEKEIETIECFSLPRVSLIKFIFTGPKGIRAGWRLPMFFLLLGIPGTILLAIAHGQAATTSQRRSHRFCWAQMTLAGLRAL